MSDNANSNYSGLTRLSSVAEITLSYRNSVPFEDRYKISNSRDAFSLLRQVWSENIELLEEFVVLLLDRSHRVLGYYKLSQGGVSGTVVDVKVLFACILKARASSFMLAHNHPSGNARPSQADIDLTNKISNGAKLLDLVLLDHLIVTGDNERYYSFADNGKI